MKAVGTRFPGQAYYLLLLCLESFLGAANAGFCAVARCGRCAHGSSVGSRVATLPRGQFGMQLCLLMWVVCKFIGRAWQAVARIQLVVRPAYEGVLIRKPDSTSPQSQRDRLVRG